MKSFLIKCKILFFIVFIICSTIFPIYLAKNTACADTMVYITETGKCYHRSGCIYLKKSSELITLESAIHQGYRKCSVCFQGNPDLSPETTSRNSTNITSTSTGKSNFILWIVVGSAVAAIIIIGLIKQKQNRHNNIEDINKKSKTDADITEGQREDYTNEK